MQLKDDLQREKIAWEYGDVGRDWFYLDFYSYCTVELNIRRAVKSKSNMNMYYDREGWIKLLMYYCYALEAMVYEIPEAWYIVPQNVMYEIQCVEQWPLKYKYWCPYHDTSLTDKQIIDLFISIAKYIQCIMRQCFKMSLAGLEEQIQKIDKDGDDKQEDDKAEESEMEEAIGFKQ